jgi:DNA-binding response OmpR family regulator
MMPNQSKVFAFDLDAESLTSLREAFPDWEIKSLAGATTESLVQNWNPGTAELLVVGVHGQTARTLGLCRGLRSQAGRTHTALFVLVAPGQDALVKAVLDAGADSCLTLPVHAKELVSMLTRARQGNQPGRHTLSLERAQSEDRWRDEGGES